MTRAKGKQSTQSTTLAVRGDAKLQRWVDLIAALLARRFPVTFDDLARDVPEYFAKVAECEAAPAEDRRKTLRESLKRTFERDKEELREFGVPIESLPDEEGNEAGRYRLKGKDFFLPFLACTLPSSPTTTHTAKPMSAYAALASLTFDPDEIAAVVDAVAVVRSLGDPLLAAHAESALRKLAVDLPIDSTAESDAVPKVVLPKARPDAVTFEQLSDALVRRKLVTFVYRAMGSDRSEERQVEPWGLFFLSGHWYLAARDVAREGVAVRNFRLNRVESVRVNGKKRLSPDFEVPTEFRLREHARSRQAWELGEGDALQVVVDFRGPSGPTVAASALGAPSEGEGNRRVFAVRRADVFVRWLLSFVGETVPVGPVEIVDAYWAEMDRTAHLYATPAVSRVVSPTRSGTAAAAVQTWEPKGAATQLRRILNLVPRIADGESHRLSEIAAGTGTSVETIRRDLFSLVTRFDVPAGFVDGVQLFFESDSVSAVPNHFKRPMRLTASELRALELGIAVLQATRPPDERAPLRRARERL
ncbi:MAG: WYL domain-containing protein, partial [Gemmatimonadaceae bacterium]